jgi:3-hydroxymyristoyl/3-hydroxydecanoyl-(acyl carrier protein) dehydratase
MERMAATERPQILSSQQVENGLQLRLKIPATLSYFPGHFPAHPVLPGVVQLRWVEELAREFNLINGEFLRIDKLKFMRIMSRDYEVVLDLSIPKENTLQFQYSSEHGIHGSGRIIFQ